MYTIEEVAALLERTTDHRRQADSTSHGRQGLTPDEPSIIAFEAGV